MSTSTYTLAKQGPKNSWSTSYYVGLCAKITPPTLSHTQISTPGNLLFLKTISYYQTPKTRGHQQAVGKNVNNSVVSLVLFK